MPKLWNLDLKEPHSVLWDCPYLVRQFFYCYFLVLTFKNPHCILAPRISALKAALISDVGGAGRMSGMLWKALRTSGLPMFLHIRALRPMKTRETPTGSQDSGISKGALLLWNALLSVCSVPSWCVLWDHPGQLSKLHANSTAASLSRIGGLLGNLPQSGHTGGHGIGISQPAMSHAQDFARNQDLTLLSSQTSQLIFLWLLPPVENKDVTLNDF